MSTAEKTAEAAPPSLMAKLKIPLLILGIVVVEFVVVYLFFPSSQPPAPQPEKEAAKELPPEPVKEPEEEPVADASKADKEVDLGEFSVSAHQAASNVTYRVDFHLYGTIPADKDEEYTKLMETKGKRVREQVLVTVRSSELADLTDAGLGLIKRRILATTNKILGKPLMQSVVFTDFRFNEQ
ncbi:MAG: hypothetical protein JNM18_15050 [Planctomycetaceae bacterium]|nr:hypothetical protein [Planctomycetaceae bacterium]